MTLLQAHGLSVEVPHGWEAELWRQEDPSLTDPQLDPAQSDLIVLHLANFDLPASRDDYGTQAVEGLRPDGVFVALIEFDRAASKFAMFRATEIPKLTAADFSPDQLLRAAAGQSGAQRFFRTADRCFCLYAVLGSHLARGLLAAEANEVVASLKIV